jgi:hypothetical protein
MSSKKKNEFREKDYSRNSEGLKQRRLKEESRWKFNPNESYESEDDLEEDDEEYGDWEQYRQGG